MTTIEQLQKCGFNAASDKVIRMKERKRKLALAYEHYRVVQQKHIDDFNQKLKEKTIKRDSFNTSYQELAFTPVHRYEEIPPTEVLDSLMEAIERKCFDAFEVAHIVKVEDPLLFGRIEGCPDRFFIAQWDNDIKITDLLKDNEG